MTLLQIESFLELCATMNFTKASQNLCITQPALSRQIQQLESELDVILLKRNNREVALTEAGEAFKREFSKITEQIDVAVDKVKRVSQAKNEIRIGFSDAVLPIHIYHLIEGLKAEFTGMTILINQYGNSKNELSKHLENGQLDAIVSLEPIEIDARGILSSDFWELPGYIVYSPDLFPDGREPKIGDFKDKRFVCTSRTGSENIVQKQKTILESLGFDVANTQLVDNVVTTLMYTQNKSAFSVFCNTNENMLRTIPLPPGTPKFKMIAYWKKDSEIPLENFFAKTSLK